MTIFRLLKATKTHPATTVWAVSGFVGLSTIAMLIAAIGATIAPAAVAAESRMTSLRGASVDQLADGDASALRKLETQISETRADIESVATVYAWVSNFSPSVSWIPMATQEIEAVGAQVERARDDLIIASSVASESSQMLSGYNNVQAALLSPGAGPAIQQLKGQSIVANESLAESVEKLSVNISHPFPQSILLQSPPFRGFAAKLNELEDEMLAASTTGYEVSSLMVDLLEVADAMQPLLTQFASTSDNSVQATMPEIEASLGKAIEYAQSARSKTDRIEKLVSETGRGEQFLPKVRALDTLLDALVTVNGGASVAINSLAPAMEKAENSQGGLLSNGALVDVFEAFEGNRQDISRAIDDLAKAETMLEEASSEDAGIPRASLIRVTDMVAELREGLKLINDLSPIASEIVAKDGVKKYLVLGQSADEIRGTGGFVSSIWLVTFSDGALDGIQYFDAVRVDDWDRLELYPTAPVGLEEHMNGQVWLLRDVSWDPDFPTTARSAEDLFRLGQRQPVDGVIAINQWTLLKMVDALGQIPSPDGGDPITSRNLIPVLEQGTDLYGRAYMDLVMQGSLDQLNGPISMPKLMRMASSLLDTLETNDTLVYLNNPEAQEVIERQRWDGGVPDTDSDYLYVVDSNVGWSKVDRNIQRDIAYTVDLSRESGPRASLSLTYSNHSSPGSPPCEPQWISRGTDYSQLKNACYWNFLRVYMPNASKVLHSTPLPLPAQSASVEKGSGVPGEETGEISSSHDKIVFSGLTTLEAGEQGEINLVYDLPPTVVSENGDSLNYEVLIQKQPGIRERGVSVKIIAPEGYAYESSSLEPFEVSGGRVTYSFDLNSNTRLNIEFGRDADNATTF